MPTMLFLPGGIELIVLGFVLVALIFGASRLPDVANAVGRLGGEFKAGRKESEKMIEDLEKEAAEQVEEENDESVPEAATSES